MSLSEMDKKAIVMVLELEDKMYTDTGTVRTEVYTDLDAEFNTKAYSEAERWKKFETETGVRETEH